MFHNSSRDSGRDLRHFFHAHGGRGRKGSRSTDGESLRAGRGHRVGRGFFGRGGGGGGRVFGPGDLRLILLSMINEKPRHGYELIKALEDKFAGVYAPSPGSVYPTLALLEELDQVRAVNTDGGKRRFEITAEGRQYLRDNEAAFTSAMTRMEMAAKAVSGESPPGDLHHAMHTR
jgi:DNA-binding PadR family transcriptional regulator